MVPGRCKPLEDPTLGFNGHHLFNTRYTRPGTNRKGLSLIEKVNHLCIMLEDGGCRIHPVKPSQCAGFPNTWNFAGWHEVCEAKPVPMAEPRESGCIGLSQEDRQPG